MKRMAQRAGDVVRSSYGRLWQPLLAITLVLEVIAAILLDRVTNDRLAQIKRPQEDPSWAIYQLDLEYQQLRLAMALGEPPDSIRLHAKLFASRIVLIRDAPAYANLFTGRESDKLRNFIREAEPLLTLVAGANPQAQVTVPQIEAAVAGLSGEVKQLAAALTQEVLANTFAARDSFIGFIHQTKAFFGLLIATMAVTIVLLWRAQRNVALGAAALNKRVAELDAVLDVTADGIIGTEGPEQRIWLWSSQAEQLFRAPAEDARGRPLPDVAGADVARQMRAPDGMRSVSAPDGTPGNHSIRMSIDGKTRHLSFSVRGLPETGGASGQTRTVIGVHDVTAIITSERQNKDLELRLAEINRTQSLGLMASSAIHDLSQPLAALKNYTYVLSNEDGIRNGTVLPAEIAKVMSAEADRAVVIIKAMRAFVPTSKKSWALFQLHDLLGEIQMAAVQSANVTVDIRPGGAVDFRMLAGDRNALSEIVTNLVRTTYQGFDESDTRTVEIGASESGRHIAIEVMVKSAKFSAIVSNEMLPSESRSSGGAAGIGIRWTRRLAEEIGCQLKVESNETGPVFQLLLPVMQWSAEGQSAESEDAG